MLLLYIIQEFFIEKTGSVAALFFGIKAVIVVLFTLLTFVHYDIATTFT